MFTQLNPPLPLFVVSKNASALAHGVIDYGPEHHLFWVCFMTANGECWTVANPDVRIEWNPTLGRVRQPATPAAELFETDLIAGNRKLSGAASA